MRARFPKKAYLAVFILFVVVQDTTASMPRCCSFPVGEVGEYFVKRTASEEGRRRDLTETGKGEGEGEKYLRRSMSPFFFSTSWAKMRLRKELRSSRYTI